MSPKANGARRRIVDAFWSLCTQKRPDQITVREVAQAAGCNRATFYLYFKDLRQLLDEEEAELLENHRRLLDLLSNSLPRLDPTDVVKLFTYSGGSGDGPDPRIALLAGPGGDPAFRENIKHTMKLFLRPHLRDTGPYAEYTLEYLCAGLLSVLGMHMQQTQALPDAAFLTYLVHLISDSLGCTGQRGEA